jgi:hypothetical protein
MAKSIDKKLTDSNSEISKDGRAQRYWKNTPLKRSASYTTDKPAETVDQFKVIDKYSLKGFEYGNWVNNNDRNDFLTATTESCEDLAKILGTKNIGCDGTIGIAFGARGRSKALAHFEPWTFMINLTKEKGFGCLAHEYGHALDYFFGMYVDQNTGFTALSGGDTVRSHIEPIGGKLRQLAMQVVNDVCKDKAGNKTATYIRLEKEFGGSEYWFRRNEIFARTFEQYIRYKKDKKGIKNTFLSQKKYENGAYLFPADFKRILPIMDSLVKEMAAFMNNKKKSVGINRTKSKIAAK